MQQVNNEEFIVLSPVCYISTIEDNIFNGFKDRFSIDGKLVMLKCAANNGISYTACSSHSNSIAVNDGTKGFLWTDPEAVSGLAGTGNSGRSILLISWFKQLNSWLKSPTINPADGTLLISPDTVGMLYSTITSAVAKEITGHIKENTIVILGRKLETKVLSGQDKSGKWGKLRRNHPDIQLLKLTTELFEDKELKLGPTVHKGLSWANALKEKAPNFGLAVNLVTEHKLPKGILSITKINDVHFRRSVLIKVVANEIRFLGAYGKLDGYYFDSPFITSLATIDLSKLGTYRKHGEAVHIADTSRRWSNTPHSEIPFWVHGVPGQLSGASFFNPNADWKNFVGAPARRISINCPYTKEDYPHPNHFPREVTDALFVPLIDTSVGIDSKEDVARMANMMLEIAGDILKLQNNGVPPA